MLTCSSFLRMLFSIIESIFVPPSLSPFLLSCFVLFSDRDYSVDRADLELRDIYLPLSFKGWD